MNRRTLLTAAAGAAAVLPAAARAAPVAGSSRSGERFVAAADGERLYVQDWGHGRTLFFVHGWTMNTEFWEYQTEAMLEAGFRVVAYDQRGCGRSSQAAFGFDFDTLADDMDAVMRALDLRDVVVVAHSMGCALVARYLSRHGASRVAKVVLASTTTPGLFLDPAAAQAVDDRLVAAIRADRPRYLAELAQPFFSPVKVTPELLRWGVDLALKASLRAAVAYTRTNVHADMRGDLGAFSMPTLIVHGSGDISTPLAQSGARTAAAIPGSRLVVYDGAPHGLPLTHSARLNQDIAAFARA